MTAARGDTIPYFISPAFDPESPKERKIHLWIKKPFCLYWDQLKCVQILISNKQARQGRTVEQEQEQISHKHVSSFWPISSIHHSFTDAKKLKIRLRIQNWSHVTSKGGAAPVLIPSKWNGKQLNLRRHLRPMREREREREREKERDGKAPLALHASAPLSVRPKGGE